MHFVSFYRQGVQDDRAMVVLLQTALNAMQKTSRLVDNSSNWYWNYNKNHYCSHFNSDITSETFGICKHVILKVLHPP